MNILEHIPYGQENAVSRKHLANLYGGGETGDRKAREAIEKARRNHVIINTQDGNGYFQPKDTEAHLVERQYRQTDHRANAINRQRRAIRKWQREHSGQTSLEV